MSAPTPRRRPGGPPWAWRLAVGAVLWVLRTLFGWRVKAQRPDTMPPPDEPLVVVFNHTSNVDAFLVVDAIWRGLGHWCQPLAKAELFDVPGLGFIARNAGAIPVSRGEGGGREAAYGAAVERLREGGTIMIAPEGTITHDGTLLPLRHGAARLALDAGVKVLVCTQFGAQRGFSPVVRVPEQDVLVTMRFDVLTPWPDEDAQALTGRIAATMMDRSQELQRTYPQAEPDARWWPPYSKPASPTETARENLDRYRQSMAEAVEHARERMSRFAADHELQQRLDEARGQARAATEDLALRSRQRAEELREQARHRIEDLAEEVRQRRQTWSTPGGAEDREMPVEDTPTDTRTPVARDGYDRLRRGFRWKLPDEFNMGVACSDAHDPTAPAMVAVAADDSVRTWTFGEISVASNRLANVLAGMGVERGDRVGVVVPQSVETAIAHVALWKMGAVSLPMASLLGPDALAFRLSDCDARAVITSPENVDKLREAAPDLPLLVTGEWEPLLSDASEDFSPVATSGEDPAYLIYTSGTTGQPKGALHAHRSLFGHLPGFECYYEFSRFAPMGRYDLAVLPHDGSLEPPPVRDLIWTPADWAWIGGLMDVLVPAWYYGLPVLTADHDFDPEWAVRLMASQRVTLAFLPPTALKMMRAAGTGGADLALRSVFTGGEPLGEAMLQWCEQELGAVPNEGYGQTECNLVVGNCRSEWPIRPGSMGRALPGHEVQVQDEDGNRVVGTLGEICVKAPDPVMMLGYWGRPDATEEKYRGGWLLTGDLGEQDEDGYLWFSSRKDDVINSMGYRIGPGEIEDSLMRHPAVSMCAVIGVPDEVRGHVPAAFVVLKDDVTPSDQLATELQQHVRTRLAAHEVPRRITFVDDLPRTVTGKVMRRALRDVDPEDGGRT